MSAIAMVDRAKTAISLGESHFREFKSALDGRPGEKLKRPVRDICINISQTLVGFANADGGELLVGVEDSGEITGLIGFTEEEFSLLQEAPKSHVHASTPLPEVRRFRLELDGKPVLYFSVPKSTRYVHVTSDGRCLQRRDLETVPVAAEAIQFDRDEQKSREYDRQFVDGVSADDLDLDLVRVVSDQVMRGMSAERCLQYLELGEYGMAQLRLRRGALLLFAKHPSRWHPRLQVRILKVDGDEIRTGEAYNVVTDQIISGNILTLVDQAWEGLRPYLVHTKFDKTGRFEQRSMYPELACREALLNAIAHRDYSEEGKGVEIYIFDSHLEFRNPGALLSTIKLEDISQAKGVHQSRNTNVARVLRELGYMRELGEGMRRIYELMHKNELAPPALASTAEDFRITLTHRPLYSERDQLWLSQFDMLNLDREQKAVVLLGQEGRIFSAQQIWDAVGIVDTEHYRKLVVRLQTLDVLRSPMDREKAQRVARSRKIPFRQFPRYSIRVPGESSVLESSGVEVEVERVDEAEVRKPLNSVLIGNLPADMTEKELFDSFEFVGEILEIRMPSANGSSKGFALIEFKDHESVKKAMKADGLEYEGRKLAIRAGLARARGRRGGRRQRKDAHRNTDQ